MGLLDKFENLLHEAVDGKMLLDDDYPNIVLQAAGKSSFTLRAITTLCIAGLPDAAFALARNIYEQSIILSFFETIKSSPDFDAYVKDYYIDRKYQSIKDAMWRAEMIANDQSAVQGYKSQIERLQNETSRHIGRDYWWARQTSFYNIVMFIINSFSDTPQKKEMLTTYSLYKRACKDIHADSFGNTLRLGSERVCYGVDNTAKTSGHGLPLHFAVYSFCLVTLIVFNTLSIDDKGLLSDLDHLADLYMAIDYK